MGANFIGLYLVRTGVISRDQLEQALALQRKGNRRIGDMAVERGLLTPEQARDVFTAQSATERPFGETALDLGLLERQELDALLFSQNVANSHLGETLLDMGLLNAEQFGGLLAAYHAEEAARAEALRRSFGGGAPGLAAEALVEALERAFLRFLGLEVKAAQEAGDAGTLGGPARRLRLGLPDGRFLEFLLRPAPGAEECLGRAAAGLRHGGAADGPRGADAFFAIVADYARAIAAGEGLLLAPAGVPCGPADDLRPETPGLARFCLITPRGVLLTVLGRLAAGPDPA